MENSNLRLRTLLATDELSFRRAVDEFKEKEPEWPFAFHFEESTQFAEYVRRLDCWTKGQELPESFVPNTFLVGVVENTIIGRVSIRHELTDYLSKYGGHAGYGVVPSQRNRGYASRMLRLTLPIAARLGLVRLLVTCDEDNVASQMVIEKTGGVLEDIVKEPGAIVRKKRYWIETI
jgi:predicted acetyltransferase